jgi:4-hydroxy-tetrahydrodipicolinate synthase
MKKLFGTGVALVTPFTSSLKVDFKALKKLMTHTAKGVDYYVVMGTTGESVTCSEKERRDVLAFVLENNTRNLPMVYGIGGNSTEAVIDTIRSADLIGVDAILSVSPYYNKPSQEGIAAHFNALADVSPVPLILYNVPGRTSSNMKAETTLRLAEHPNIIGIKEAVGSLSQYMAIAKHKPREFMLISGDDLWTAPLYALGGQGVISVLANAFPLIFRKVKELSLAGKHVAAHQQLQKLLEINGPMYEEGSPTGIKYVLSRIGLCEPHVRLPMTQASASLRQRIDALLVDIKK